MKRYLLGLAIGAAIGGVLATLAAGSIGRGRGGADPRPRRRRSAQPGRRRPG